MVPKSIDRDIRCVTQEQCRIRHTRSKWVLGIVIALLSLFMATFGLAVRAGFDATESATRNRSMIDQMNARGDERDKRFEQLLIRVEADLATQRKMIEDLWRQDHGS